MVTQERKLAAIMFTDIVGYTALSQQNESLALEMLEDHRSLIRPLFSKFNGREVKTIGDAFLVEFESALEATECAVELQKALHGDGQNPSKQVHLRVGIHVGDVVHREGDVYGDAVNIASRIYPLAMGGEICISEQVYDQVRNKVPFRLVKLGPKDLKNVATPVDVYKVELPWEGANTRMEEISMPPDRIAVLPFVNISPDPSDEFFADGLTEELITSLSLVKGLKVIARTSAMNYKKKEKSVSEIGRELGVGTVVEGSVRRAANRIRVTVQVIDVKTEEHLFASNYDRSLDDIFAVQSDIASKVAESVPSSLGRRKSTELSKGTEDVTAYMHFLQGRELVYEKTEAPLRQALDYFERAVGRDPSFARAYAGMAQAYISLGSRGLISWSQAIESSRFVLNKALAINENLPEAHALLSEIAYMADEPAEVMEAEARKAIELNPNLADAYRVLGEVMALRGQKNDWVTLLETAYHLDPLSTRIVERLGGAYFYTGRETDALDLWNKTLELDPLNSYRWLTDFYLSKGDLDKAKATVEQLQRLGPTWDFTLMYVGYLAALKGDEKTAQEMIGALEESHKRGWSRAALAGYIYYALGNTDAFFGYMSRAAQDHTLPASSLIYSPLFAKARGDRRMSEILAAAGINPSILH